MASRCDGLIRFLNNLIFVELKERRRPAKDWLEGGMQQIIATLEVFKQNYNIADFDKVEAYVCNRLKPLAHRGYNARIQRFKDETGLILNPTQVIDLGKFD